MRWWIVIVAIVLILAVILTIRAFYEYASLIRTDYEIETVSGREKAQASGAQRSA